MPLEPLEVHWGAIHWLLRSFLQTEDPDLRAAYQAGLDKYLMDDEYLRTALQRLGPRAFLQCMDAGRSLKEIYKLGNQPEINVQTWQEMLLPADSLFMRIYGIKPNTEIEHDVKNDFVAHLLSALQHDLGQGTSPAEFLNDLTQRLGEIPAGQDFYSISLSDAWTKLGTVISDTATAMMYARVAKLRADTRKPPSSKRKKR